MAEHLQTRLDALLEDRRKKPAPFAKEVGLGPDLIRDILRKGSMPSADRLALIADGLGVTTDYLLGRTDDPTASKQGPITTEPEILAFLSRIDKLSESDITVAFTVIKNALDAKRGAPEPSGSHDQPQLANLPRGSKPSRRRPQQSDA